MRVDIHGTWHTAHRIFPGKIEVNQKKARWRIVNRGIQMNEKQVNKRKREWRKERNKNIHKKRQING